MKRLFYVFSALFLGFQSLSLAKQVSPSSSKESHKKVRTPRIDPLIEGHSRVQFPDGTFGFMNEAGTLLPGRYKDVLNFSEGRAAVQFLDDETFGFIDKAGTPLPERYKMVWSFHKGRALVQFLDGETFGFIDKAETPLPERYKMVWSFHKGRALVQFLDGETFGFIDKAGTLLPERYKKEYIEFQ